MDEALVDLQYIDRVIVARAQGGNAGAKIVHDDREAVLTEFAKQRDHIGAVIDNDAFGDFKFQFPGMQETARAGKLAKSGKMGRVAWKSHTYRNCGGFGDNKLKKRLTGFYFRLDSGRSFSHSHPLFWRAYVVS